MLDKDTLRKADLFSGAIVSLFGIFVVGQSLKMPMKDTYGGVQNVWYVSPAIFPLFIGSVVTLLGITLTGIALKAVGLKKLVGVIQYLTSHELVVFLMKPATIRFYAVVIVFSSFIFVMIPRVDFFLAAILFLMVFISLFYFDDDGYLKKSLLFFLAINAVLVLFFMSGLSARLSTVISYPGDWLVLFFIVTFILYAGRMIKTRNDLSKKYRTCLILATAAPLLIGIIFKYLLLVPMPFEGAAVELLDAIWYYEY